MPLTDICQATENYAAQVPKSDRKGFGQFFTSEKTAEYMASFINREMPAHVTVIDPGAGSGILSAAAVTKLLTYPQIRSIHLICYENNEAIQPLLQSNLELMQRDCLRRQIQFVAEVKTENFVTGNQTVWNAEDGYEEADIIICNPPYQKIRRDSEEARTMNEIVYGQPNIYYLFMAMSLKLLRTGGDFIFIVPRSWTSGLYFQSFRRYFFRHLDIADVHLFQSRNSVFDTEDVLQETMIIHGQKRGHQPQREQILMHTSKASEDFSQAVTFPVQAQECIQMYNGHYFLLPTSERELEVLYRMRDYQHSLSEEGYRFKTGQVIEFRHKQSLRRRNDQHLIPIISSPHFKAGRVQFPSDDVEWQYLIDHAEQKLFMPNKDYLLVKRMTAKEERRRLQPAIYFKNEVAPQSQWVSTENHLNYLVKQHGTLSEEEIFGIFVLLNSSLWDEYYRILNGSTQVNASELNSMPVPSAQKIVDIGMQALNRQIRTSQDCDLLLEELL
ncbi:MAG: Eco57I restriction-modification methylase domain-containing protein [Oscillospiraceae bacterium]|jgi:adenine-specific DNA-methyltransferase|nr:Eco57I restriction-modification methylase domain-containing protein [Oscillospiraceae bacterium]